MEILSHRRVLVLAVPIMLAQAATAATGVVDTAVMGLYGGKAELAAVAVASLVFSFVYWAFGFLRMSTTGLVAQAFGAKDKPQAEEVLLRALVLGLVVGIVLIIVSPWLSKIVFRFFDIELRVLLGAQDYFGARIWGAPAQLMGYGILGWLLGSGKTRLLLLLQLLKNGTNAVLDLGFVVWLDLGSAGIGAGTAIAEWVMLIAGVWVVRRHLRPSKSILDKERWRGVVSANRDILVRTLALLFCFFWFVRSGAKGGTAVVAGNEVLLQFIAVSGFVLDGFAFVAEKEVGEAYGARNRSKMIRAMRVTTHLALALGLLFAASYYFLGPLVISSIIEDTDARGVALLYMPYCALIPLLGVFAWQLDGFFLGATQGRPLRIAALLTTVLYVLLDIVLRASIGESGIWLAFISMYVIRALSLSVFVPGLVRGLETGHKP